VLAPINQPGRCAARLLGQQGQVCVLAVAVADQVQRRGSDSVLEEVHSDDAGAEEGVRIV